MLATLRHGAAWVQRQRPFLAGKPTQRIPDIGVDDPEWKGLADIQVTRLKAAAEQLIHVKRRRNQHPVRDYAIFQVLLRTALRVSELLRLDLDQYQGKHFVNVRREGRKVSRQVFVAAEAREALDRYIEEIRAEGLPASATTRSRNKSSLWHTSHSTSFTTTRSGFCGGGGDQASSGRSDTMKRISGNRAAALATAVGEISRPVTSGNPPSGVKSSVRSRFAI